MPSPRIRHRFPHVSHAAGAQRRDDAVPPRSCGLLGVFGVASEPVELVTMPPLLGLAAGAASAAPYPNRWSW